MRCCVGLDVQLRSTAFAVIAANGKGIKGSWSRRMARLVEVIRLIPGQLHVRLEEATQGAWLVERLRPFAERIVVSLPDFEWRRATGGMGGSSRKSCGRTRPNQRLQAPAHLAALQCACEGI